MSKKDKLVPWLKEILGEANIIKNPDAIKPYAMDGRRPKAIGFPGTIEEVSKVVAFAQKEHLTIVPRGNGTKIGMGGIPEKMDLVLSTTRLNRITDSDCENLTLCAESGITLDEVQRHLSGVGKGYFLPLDPPFTERATLGGIVATNSSGPKRLLYGTARDLITGIKTVFPNGDVVVSGGKTVKNVSGYDMCKLLIGSFGTLGLICEVTFKLLPLPARKATLLVPFSALDRANGFVDEITHSQLIPASVEILSANAVERMRPPLPIPAGIGCLVAIGLEGVSEAIERQISEIDDLGKKHGALETATLNSDDHESFWTEIRGFPEKLLKDHPGLICLKSNFLASKWGEMLASYERIAREYRKNCAFICHSGSGILYSYIMEAKNLRSKMESLVGFIERLTSEAVRNEGNLVVESSPSSIKKRVNVWGQPRRDFRIMRCLKEQIDPQGVFGRGRFVGGI